MLLAIVRHNSFVNDITILMLSTQDLNHNYLLFPFAANHSNVLAVLRYEVERSYQRLSKHTHTVYPLQTNRTSKAVLTISNGKEAILTVSHGEAVDTQRVLLLVVFTVDEPRIRIILHNSQSFTFDLNRKGVLTNVSYRNVAQVSRSFFIANRHAFKH